jgi:hypothetical protein
MKGLRLMSDTAAKKLLQAAEVSGAGRYAVVFCRYLHPCAGLQKPKVKRFATLADAERASRDHGLSWPDECKFGYCHGCAKTKSVVSRHPVVDL